MNSDATARLYKPTTPEMNEKVPDGRERPRAP
jgi:hypothetical protein